jgi:hypothetical protein
MQGLLRFPSAGIEKNFFPFLGLARDNPEFCAPEQGIIESTN